MGKAFVVTESAGIIKDVIDFHTDKVLKSARVARISRDYKDRYVISGEIAEVKGRRVHVDYLPTIDAMISAQDKYPNSIEVVGAALYKIEKDNVLFLTDTKDPNLRRVYKKNRINADVEKANLWRLVSEGVYDMQWTHVIAGTLSGSFQFAFGQSLGAWRKSLSA